MEFVLNRSNIKLTLFLLSLQLFVQYSHSRAIGVDEVNTTPERNWLQENYYRQDDSRNLTVVYSDDNVVFYFDDVRGNKTPSLSFQSHWSFATFSKMWKYINTVYNVLPSVEQDQRLHIFIHTGQEKFKGIQVVSNYSSETLEFPKIIEFNCGQHLSPEEKCDISSLTESLVDLIWSVATQTMKSDKGDSNGDENQVYRKWRISSLILYDIYFGIGSVWEENIMAEDFKNKEVEVVADFPQTATHLFRDWYLPIYEQHGGNEVIQSFFNNINFYMMLKCSSTGSDNCHEREFDETLIKMTPGVFVHFWSGSAGKDLRELASKAFGWTHEYQKQFTEAQNTFPFFNYSSDPVNMEVKASFDGDDTSEEAMDFSLSNSLPSFAFFNGPNKELSDARVLLTQIFVVINVLTLIALVLAFLIHTKKIPFTRKRFCGYTADEVDGLIIDRNLHSTVEKV